MLAVVGDRFQRTGDVSMSIMVGIGMMSAGLIGSAGLGYAKDRYAGEALKAADMALYEEYKSTSTSGFLFFGEVVGLDGQKVEAIKALPEGDRSPDQQKVVEASIQGDRQTLIADSFIPGTMAVIYLLLMLYFKSIGGYKTVHLAGSTAERLDPHDEVIPAKP